MGAMNLTVWTCDRCKTEKELPERGQPNGWGTVTVADPPLSAEPKIEGVYCASCLYDMRVLLANAPAEAAAS